MEIGRVEIERAVKQGKELARRGYPKAGNFEWFLRMNEGRVSVVIGFDRVKGQDPREVVSIAIA